MKEVTTKEDIEPKRQRRQSADEEDGDKEAVTYGGPYLSESRDGDNSEGVGKLR